MQRCEIAKGKLTVGSFIPAGRTSLVKRGESMLQVQTEYAPRPYPRITTTILNQGQVLHKLEKKLEQAIGSVEEQNLAEDVMKRQHAEVLSLITDPTGEARQRLERAAQEPTIVFRRGARPAMEGETASAVPAAGSGALPGPEPLPDLPDDAPAAPTARPYPSPVPPIAVRESLHDRFADIPGFEHAYSMTLDGKFKSAAGEEQFRKGFKHVHKTLRDVIELFPEKGGARRRREEGVCEVERNRLYLVSTGEELVFITINSIRTDLNYEKIMKNLLFPDELQVLLQQRGADGK